MKIYLTKLRNHLNQFSLNWKYLFSNCIWKKSAIFLILAKLIWKLGKIRKVHMLRISLKRILARKFNFINSFILDLRIELLVSRIWMSILRDLIWFFFLRLINLTQRLRSRRLANFFWLIWQVLKKCLKLGLKVKLFSRLKKSICH